ncbi:unnamed protein product, partial [Ixodes persulcatus]
MSPALLLHGRKPKTRLHILALSPRELFRNPVKEMKRLRERVCQRQQSSKKYTDQRRGAKRPTFVVGQFVHYRLPKKTRYDKSKFSEPLKIVERVGHWTFRLEDG